MSVPGFSGSLTDVAVLVWVLILAPILPLLITLAIIVVGVVPGLGWRAPTAMFSILITLEIDVLFLAALIFPSDKLLDQTLKLSGLIVAGAEIQARNTLGAFVAFVVAWTVPALADETVCGIRLGLW